MLEFFNYYYIHKKYSIGPSCRDSSISDTISELEKEVAKKWVFEFNEIFAKAGISNNILKFKYINKEVVDEKPSNIRRFN